MPPLPGIYSQGIGSIEILSGRGIDWGEVFELADNDDGNERELANRCRAELRRLRD